MMQKTVIKKVGGARFSSSRYSINPNKAKSVERRSHQVQLVSLSHSFEAPSNSGGIIPTRRKNKPSLNMAPSATTDLPPPSALGTVLDNWKEYLKDYQHPVHLQHLASTILHNLQHQHDWTCLMIHTHSILTNLPLPRPIVSGIPPKRAYIHPDEQSEIIKAEHEAGKSIEIHPEPEWVLPTHMGEKWSLSKFVTIFDSLDTVPLTDEDSQEENSVGENWRGKNRQKRLLLATLHDDSTVVYYIMHDGIVKPRQN